jgi:NAD(P)-dependent dehydrogenase (short-subunit alcohol dehydrogenase family)
MARQKRGRIINVTAGLAEFVMPRLGAYSISKAALNHFTRVLAKELDEYNIKVYGLDPGTVNTRMHETLRGMDIKKLGPEAYRIFWTLKQSGQLKDPAEVASLAVFLASEKADDISGEVGTESHFMRWGYRTAA